MTKVAPPDFDVYFTSCSVIQI